MYRVELKGGKKNGNSTKLYLVSNVPCENESQKKEEIHKNKKKYSNIKYGK